MRIKKIFILFMMCMAGSLSFSCLQASSVGGEDEPQNSEIQRPLFYSHNFASLKQLQLENCFGPSDQKAKALLLNHGMRCLPCVQVLSLKKNFINGRDLDALTQTASFLNELYRLSLNDNFLGKSQETILPLAKVLGFEKLNTLELRDDGIHDDWFQKFSQTCAQRKYKSQGFSWLDLEGNEVTTQSASSIEKLCSLFRSLHILGYQGNREDRKDVPLQVKPHLPHKEWFPTKLWFYDQEREIFVLKAEKMTFAYQEPLKTLFHKFSRVLINKKMFSLRKNFIFRLISALSIPVFYLGMI